MNQLRFYLCSITDGSDEEMKHALSLIEDEARESAGTL